MKFLIWFSCFFILVVIQVILKNMGYILGALPVMLLFSLSWWSASTLCKIWDEHKAQKEANKANTEPGSASISKQRYCKLCGGEVCFNTHKCTKCGKQYFYLHITKRTILITSTIAIIIGLAVLNVYQHIQHQNELADLSSQIAQLESTIESQQEDAKRNEAIIEQYKRDISTKSDEVKKLQTEKNQMLLEISFYDFHVVFVSNDGTKLYHKYDCSNFDSSYFWAYNTEAAKSHGYTPCSECCK